MIPTERTDLQTWVMEYVKQRIADGERWDILSEVRRLARCITSEPFMLHEEQLLPVLEDSEALYINFVLLMHKLMALMKKYAIII